MVIALWVIVGLFWVGVGVNHFINLSDSRKAWRKRLSDKTTDILFDAIDWVRVNVFRRKSWTTPASDANITLWLASKGIRSYVKRDPEGTVEIFIHQDDQAKLADLFNELGYPAPGYTGDALTKP